MRSEKRGSPQHLFEKWRYTEDNRESVCSTDIPKHFTNLNLGASFAKPNQREEQENLFFFFFMIIADSATKPKGLPYPLLDVQALINFCDNINIPDSLYGLILPTRISLQSLNLK